MKTDILITAFSSILEENGKLKNSLKMLTRKIKVQAELDLFGHKNIEFTDASNLKKAFTASDTVLMAKKKGIQVQRNLADIN